MSGHVDNPRNCVPENHSDNFCFEDFLVSKVFYSKISTSKNFYLKDFYLKDFYLEDFCLKDFYLKDFYLEDFYLKDFYLEDFPFYTLYMHALSRMSLWSFHRLYIIIYTISNDITGNLVLLGAESKPNTIYSANVNRLCQLTNNAR